MSTTLKIKRAISPFFWHRYVHLVLLTAPWVRHVYSPISPNKKIASSDRSGTSWSAITCRPYRAKGWDWIPSYKYFAPKALWSAAAPPLNAPAICGSESITTDAAASAETGKKIG